MSEADSGPPPLEAVSGADDLAEPTSSASLPPPTKTKKRVRASAQKKVVSTGRKKKKKTKAVLVPEPPNVVNRSLTKQLYCVLCYKGPALVGARWGLCPSCLKKMGGAKDQ